VDAARWAARRPLLVVDMPRTQPGRHRNDDRPIRFLPALLLTLLVLPAIVVATRPFSTTAPQQRGMVKSLVQRGRDSPMV
jgi:hypothetical protein